MERVWAAFVLSNAWCGKLQQNQTSEQELVPLVSDDPNPRFPSPHSSRVILQHQVYCL